mgnify:FL=1
MVFTSISFIYYFLPLLLICYFVVPKKFRNIILLMFSVLFYFYGEPKYILLMLIEVFISYVVGLLIDKYKNKNILIIGIFIHVLLFGIFKYFNFVIINVNNLFHSNLNLLNVVLPIGISFYTFQIISYEIDVYNKKVNVQSNILKYFLYVFLFPQLIAGPIVRYQDVNNEIDNRNVTFEMFARGVRRFIIGLSKKVIIANNLGELCNIYLNLGDKSVLFTWIFAISYMLQIYFDFSGYSDIAIGLGKMLGFNFPENFNYPYMAKSITDFWRRWHMTLSSWFRDYVYIPLGGNKKGVLKQIRNILIVWSLTGLWHGASWNFIVWGLYFGILLILEKFILKKYFNNVPKFIKGIYTLFFVMISFVIFQGDNLSSAFNIIKGLFGLNGELFINNVTLYYLRGYVLFIVLGVIGATNYVKNLVIKISNGKGKKIINILEPIYLLILLIIVTMYLIDSSYNPFLYFRF